MLWIEPGMIFYAAAFGGLTGAAGVAYAMRKNHSDMMKMLESYWNSDVKHLKGLIEQQNQKIKSLSHKQGFQHKQFSTKTVGKPV